MLRARRAAPMPENPANNTVDSRPENTAVLKRALERERARRMQAEHVLETRSRELYLVNEKLLKTNLGLAEAAQMLETQSHVISGLSDKHAGVTQDLTVAARLQQSMLPEPLTSRHIRVAGGFVPASFTSGDGYDYFTVDDKYLVFYLIDVSGHGMASALISFAVQNHLKMLPQSLRMRGYDNDFRLDEVVFDAIRELNATFLTRDDIPYYFTMVFGVLNFETGHTCFARAGHPSPLHMCDSGVLEYAKGGLPVGMFNDAQCQTETCTLNPGERFVVYSDGVTECESTEGEAFGVENLKQQIADTRHLDPDNAVRSLEDCLYHWQASRVFEDDVSILIIDIPARGDF